MSSIVNEHFSAIDTQLQILIMKVDDIQNKHIPDIISRLETMDRKLDNLILSVNNICTFLSITQKGFSTVSTSNSPRELSEFGTSLLEDIGGKKYLDESSPELIEIIKSKSPKSGLDVENYANILLTEKTEDDKFVPIKNYIFQNPVYRRGNAELDLTMTIVLQIMGIYLRNKYFEKYPELHG